MRFPFHASYFFFAVLVAKAYPANRSSSLPAIDEEQEVPPLWQYLNLRVVPPELSRFANPGRIRRFETNFVIQHNVWILWDYLEKHAFHYQFPSGQGLQPRTILRNGGAGENGLTLLYDYTGERGKPFEVNANQDFRVDRIVRPEVLWRSLIDIDPQRTGRQNDQPYTWAFERMATTLLYGTDPTLDGLVNRQVYDHVGNALATDANVVALKETGVEVSFAGFNLRAIDSTQLGLLNGYLACIGGQWNETALSYNRALGRKYPQAGGLAEAFEAALVARHLKAVDMVQREVSRRQWLQFLQQGRVNGTGLAEQT